MNVEIVSIGNEVLSGIVINSNAAFLSQELVKLGFNVSRQTTLPDGEKALREGLQEAMQRSSLVITTGGLGPTIDDITRNVAAGIFDSDFVLNEEIAEDLRKRYGDKISSLIDQATVPRKAIILKNPSGTAPGFIFEGQSTLVLLPGVPPEMKEMFTRKVVPYLTKAIAPFTRRYSRHLFFSNLPEMAVDTVLRKLPQEGNLIEYGIYPGQGSLAVYLSVQASDEASALKQLQPILNVLQTEFAKHLFDSPTGRLEHAVHQLLIEKGKTLSAAESCTGGHFAARLIQIPGASQYFLGSIVAYSNQMKEALLNVPAVLIEKNGAVSEAVVTAMLQGALEKTKSDYAVAATGVAGPSGGTPQKPVGTVWCGVGKRGGKSRVWQLHAYGNRDMVIERSVNALLAELLLQLRD